MKRPRTRHARRTFKVKRARTAKKRGGVMSNTFQILVASPNVSEKDRTIILFLWKKLEEFRSLQRIPEKNSIYAVIDKVLRNMQASYMNGNYQTIQGSPEILESLSYLFDELDAEFVERLQNPVKSCVPMPGKWGKPATCPEKDSEKLQTCIADTTEAFKEAKYYRRKLNKIGSKNTAVGGNFIHSARLFFEAVQKSVACRAFSRLDNFAKNEGMYMKGHIALFNILANVYLGTQISENTVSNASSINAFSNEEYSQEE